MTIRLAFHVFVLALSGAFAHWLMLAAGLWSTGLFLAPFGLVAGLAVGWAETPVRRAFGHPAVGFWKGGVLGWSAFGLVASVVAWASLQLALPDPSMLGLVAFSSPAIVAASFAAGTIQALFASAPDSARFARQMALSFAVSGFLMVVAIRLEQPWRGVALVTPLWTALVVRALRA